MTSRADSGFTLLETLVALTVFAMVAAALQVCLSRGWAGIDVVDKEMAALQLARTKLAAAGIDSPLAEGTEEGSTADGFAWSQSITRHEPRDGERFEDPQALDGYWVRVKVGWRAALARGDREVVLTTVKIGRRGQ